ncbi:MAG: phenylacetate-CoA ligase [Rhodothermales bacterium]|jgi:phenylacetate-CoA ligase
MYNALSGRDIRGSLEKAVASEAWSHSQLTEYRLGAIRKLVQSAMATVPFYSERYSAAGLDSSQDIRTLADFASLPTVTKDDLRVQTERFLSSSRGKLKYHSTSGSTGSPLVYPTDRVTDASNAASLWQGFRWHGVSPIDRSLYLWGSPTYLALAGKPSVRGVGKLLTIRAKNWMMNRSFHSIYSLGPSTYDKISAEILEGKIVYMRGMASALAAYARYVDNCGQSIPPGRLRAVWSCCELLLDSDRALIKRALGVETRNTYGLSELGEVAMEGSCGALHTMDYSVYAENDDGQGWEGNEPGDGGAPPEIILTHFKNYSSPLIRYRSGDLGEVQSVESSPCECNHSYGSITSINGRRHDVIKTGDGKAVHGQTFSHIVQRYPGITRFSVHQYSLESYLVRVSGSPNDSELASLKRDLSQVLPGQIEIRETATLPTGKHRWITSDVKDSHT